MSLVWTIIATFLYIEIAVVLLLVLPIASPSRWQRFFKSQFLTMIGRQAHIYFVLLMGVLVLFLLEAIREMRKYSKTGKLSPSTGHFQLALFLCESFFQSPALKLISTLKCSTACACSVLNATSIFPAFQSS